MFLHWALNNFAFSNLYSKLSHESLESDSRGWPFSIFVIYIMVNLESYQEQLTVQRAFPVVTTSKWPCSSRGINDCDTF